MKVKEYVYYIPALNEIYISECYGSVYVDQRSHESELFELVFIGEL